MIDLFVITCYYNPERYRTKLQNYLMFESTLRESGLHWLTLECSMGSSGFELPERGNVIRVRGRDVMWQKERLLNVALQSVPARFSKVAWLDCDVLFSNEDWAVETSALLDRYAVVQPFETVVRLPRGEVSDRGDGERWQGFAGACLRDPHALLTGDFVRHGHTGFAWAARREILSRHGLYDGCIAGSGDHMMAHSFAGDWHGKCIRRIFGENREHWRHFAEWSSRIYGDVRAAISFTPGLLLHLWHGETQNRRYVHRNRDLAGFSFDPFTDVRVGANGCWEWSSAKPELHTWAANYFGLRKEDGDLVLQEESTW